MGTARERAKAATAGSNPSCSPYTVALSTEPVCVKVENDTDAKLTVHSRIQRVHKRDVRECCDEAQRISS